MDPLTPEEFRERLNDPAFVARVKAEMASLNADATDDPYGDGLPSDEAALLDFFIEGRMKTPRPD